ncbi:hypothetical protein N480_03540 [Pseudoalteromonas luteoviolacea S2607]|uniref:DUF6265 family protein n=1 Tax=Pseudoalteromonas luteoviolacea TaxID=43657 RepID=UPI0007B07EA7|nr:DUF6265 family protein [Pseudoalteromonas luteoviolacea]KZN30030.1 hypothetical protein N480_03540 [Pseudoalteromonas luteoviolacea S2607]
MLRVILWVLLCLVFQSSLQAKTCNTVKSLAWLAGNWNSSNDKHRFNESWQQISDATFEGLGSTYSIEKKKIVSSESLRLVEMAGEVFYLAKVASNNLPIAFKLTSCTADSAIFENPQHDFPKKLRYQLTKDKNMTVFVSGDNGKGFAINFVGKNDGKTSVHSK